MSNPRTTKTIKPDRWTRFQRNLLLISCAALLCSGIGLLIIGSNESIPDGDVSADEDLTLQRSQSTGVPTAATRQPEFATDSHGQPVMLVDDDRKTLWLSPTSGPSLGLAYLAPGSQIIVSLHPCAILRAAKGEKLLTALGQLGDRAATSLEQLTYVPLAEMEKLIVGWNPTSEHQWLATCVVRAAQPITLGKLSMMHEQTAIGNHDQRYLIIGESAYHVPDRTTLVVAPTSTITDIIDLGGSPPPLRRDMERLLAHTDADRHVTILVSPNWPFSEGQSMFRGQMAALREPLFWFLGDEFSAVALSLHWDENFFIELIATPTLDTSPEKAARILMERLAQVPERVEKNLAGLEPEPYGREILARFPAMVRTMVAYTRSGFEPDHAVLRCYLPAVAGHNLLMGTELTLAEARNRGPVHFSSASKDGAARQMKNGPVPFYASVRDGLRRGTSLRFARDTLEAALEQLSEDIGVEIVIRGPDLQAEGITKNQSFEIDIANRPAEEILVEILRLANPDKTATAPNDPQQKLIYVIVATGPDGAEQVVVTTRSAAAARGDELPAVFKSATP